MTVKMVEFFDEHFYKIDNADGAVYYPSVTTILGVIQKYGLDRWRGDIGNREADMRIYDSQNRGKRIHKAWELYNDGKKIAYWRWQIDEEPECDFSIRDQGEWLDFLKLVAFRETVNPGILYKEEVVFSAKEGFAGTIDNVFQIKAGEYMINGKKPVVLEDGIYIGDLKTGNDIYDEAYMQVSAYAKMFEECGLGEVKGGLILHTKAAIKTGIVGFGVKLITKEEIEINYQDFLYAKKIWQRKNENAAPKSFEFPQVVQWEDK